VVLFVYKGIILKIVMMNKFFSIYILLIAIAALSLQACGGNAQPASPSPTFTPLLVPTPTLTPSEAILDTIPTPVISSQEPTQRFTHSANRFSIEYPSDWEQLERPDGVIFVDPGDTAGYSVVFSDIGQPYNNQELNQYLVTFVAQNFAGEGSGFKAIRQEQQPDGSVMAQFSWLDPHLGQAIVEVRVFQKDTTVFIVYFSTIEEQWEVSYNAMQKLADSFNPLDTTSVVDVAPTEESPIWALIGPESKEFGFLYATNWEILEQGEDVVSVREPKLNMVFTASNFVWPDATNDPQAAKKAALAHIDTLSEEYENVQSLPPMQFPLDTAIGSTIDFYYTTSDGANIAGSVITAVNNDKMHKIVFTAPAEPVELYDAALQWFNPMYKSFKFLSPEDFIDEELSN